MTLNKADAPDPAAIAASEALDERRAKNWAALLPRTAQSEKAEGARLAAA
jgi:hypothetical protein